MLRPLDEAEARSLAARLRETGVESVAVCLLHSYVHPGHERLLGRILAEELPGVTISLSSEILREQREYERTATTVVNAYVRPLMSSYIDRIRSGLDGLGHVPDDLLGRPRLGLQLPAKRLDDCLAVCAGTNVPLGEAVEEPARALRGSPQHRSVVGPLRVLVHRSSVVA